MAGREEDGERAKSSPSTTSLSDFKHISLLGEGAFSAVYKVQRIADGQAYALKKVKLPSLSDKEKQNALNEIRLLASVQHENVISYKEAFFDEQTRCLCIITECADGGDLLQQIVKCQKARTHIDESDLWRYFLGMLFGLKELHGKKILHRDMKCANIFLGKSSRGKLVAKLGDFNVSTVAKRGLCMTQTGTPYYASPEVWRDMPYDGKSDIWSLGAVVYEACALHPPFQAKDMEGLYRKVLRGQYPRIPSHFSQNLSEIIAEMLQVNPRHRPSASELLALPVVQKHARDLGIAIPADMVGSPSELLNTIKVPRNVIDLASILPSPQYDKVLAPAARRAVSEDPVALSHRNTPLGSARSRDEQGSARRPRQEQPSAQRLRRDSHSRRPSAEQPAVPAAPEAVEAAEATLEELLSARQGGSACEPINEQVGVEELPRPQAKERRRGESQPPKMPRPGREPSHEPVPKVSKAHRVSSSSRLPRILQKESARPGLPGCGPAALPKLPRILSSPNRLPPIGVA